MHRILGVLGFGLVASVAWSQSPSSSPSTAIDYGFPPADFKRGEPPARGPELRLAIEAVEAALDACAKNGYKVAAVVVNSKDEPIALLKADGGLRIAVESAQRKAFVVIRTKLPSAAAAERVKTDLDFARDLAATGRALPGAGALPIMVGDEVIGALGVGGAPPPGVHDEACARAGIEKIADRVK
jgi:uncharacterized protein GlcG (DUF336 family)